MVRINNNLQKLDREEIFLKVTKKVNEYKKNNPNSDLISLGIGDVSKPIIKPVIDAMKNAVDDLGDMSTFKGYGAYYGYDFLKEKILEFEYKGFNFSNDEIYISNGTKTDSTSILELFDINSKICITNPMYPIYKDGAYCLNRNCTELEILEEENFIPKIPEEKFDIIYICSPSNPIGIAYKYDELKEWVKYALENDAVILYDNVYSSFIRSGDVPKSIYEIPGAKKVAIEFRSFSKNASFTGIRCSYYIIPNDIEENINVIWKQRTINRFNGTDYIVQRGAEAIYTDESQILINENLLDYSSNSLLLRNGLIDLGFEVWGGIDSPFMWVKTKDEMDSWDFFDYMLKELNIVIIPGCIFGSKGNKYFRASALGKKEDIEEALRRMEKLYEKRK